MFFELALDDVEVALLCLVSYCILVSYAFCNLCVQCWDACELGHPMGYPWSLWEEGTPQWNKRGLWSFMIFFFKFCCTIWIWEPWFWYWIQFYISSLLETRLPMHLLKVWKWLLVLVRLLSSESLDRPWMLWLPRLKLLLVCILSKTSISFCFISSFSLTLWACYFDISVFFYRLALSA